MASDNIADFQRVLAGSKKIIIVSGAGLSAGSGIATFRGSGGRWGKFDPMKLATPAAFAESQTRVWEFYHHRREELRGKVPNAAHHALARLLIPSLRNKVAPGSQVVHITQNVDGLNLTAVETVEAEVGEQADGQVIEMHGRLFGVKCTAHDCDFAEINKSEALTPAFAGLLQQGDDGPGLRREDLPRCPRPDCGQICRPDVVWFGEIPYRIDEIFDLADNADLCLVVGTSALVQPASLLGGTVKENGGKVAVFNIEVPEHADEADFMFLGKCEETVGMALGV